MIKYIGSKRKLVDSITQEVEALPDVKMVVDLFSGTSRVGHALKRKGFQVVANDYNAYAATIARCYIEADDDLIPNVESWIKKLNKVKSVDGWFTETYCRQSRFFQPKNGAMIEAMRAKLEEVQEEPLKSVLLTSLMEAADRVDSTCGIQMAYIKKWSTRSAKDLELRVPDLLPCSPHGPGTALQKDATWVAKNLTADAVYVDPPYNQHSYLGNYHIWETLINWDNPEVYGVAMKRVEVRERKSDYNSKVRHHTAFADLIDNIKAKHIIVSSSNEAFLKRDRLEEILGKKGDLVVKEFDHKRYVGAQIGIHNQEGKKVGRVGNLNNIERLYIVTV